MEIGGRRFPSGLNSRLTRPKISVLSNECVG